jgi:hypothetical protein
MTLQGSASKVVISNEDDEDKSEQVVECFKKVVGCIRSFRARYRCASSTDNFPRRRYHPQVGQARRKIRRDDQVAEE